MDCKISTEEFLSLINRGSEINFEFNDQEYWISQSKENNLKIIILTNVNHQEDPNEQVFRSIDEFIKNANLGSFKLIDVVEKFKIEVIL
ncbi:hypothetical protein WD019_19895 [Fictibacillus sp. Mic-4]|uniref:hypothetical protein n=1 Tax=Fictibacillus TaxID=1329200 RepID=UPI0003FDD102|nr:hypothetical protein [Fictibacillus gelatini]